MCTTRNGSSLSYAVPVLAVQPPGEPSEYRRSTVCWLPKLRIFCVLYLLWSRRLKWTFTLTLMWKVKLKHIFNLASSLTLNVFVLSLGNCLFKEIHPVHLKPQWDIDLNKPSGSQNPAVVFVKQVKDRYFAKLPFSGLGNTLDWPVNRLNLRASCSGFRILNKRKRKNGPDILQSRRTSHLKKIQPNNQPQKSNQVHWLCKQILRCSAWQICIYSQQYPTKIKLF